MKANSTKREMRILVFSTAFRPMIGGSEIAIEQIARHSPDIFFDVVTPRYRKSSRVQEVDGNIAVFRVGFGCRLDKYFFKILGFLKAVALHKRNHYKIIHAYQASFGALVAVYFKIFFPKVRFILTLQEGKNLARQNFVIRLIRNLIIRKADVITAISVYLKNYASGINKHSPVFLIPNGFEPCDLDNAGLDSILKERLGIQEGERVIISVSRLVEKNGMADLIKAMSKVAVPAKLLILGDGPLKNRLAALIKESNLEDKVFLLGEVPYSGVVAYLRIADVFVRPSLSEGLGNAFLEAMAAGVPIIGTSVGGIPDFLKDGESGLFCRVGDPDDIVRKINRVLGDSRLRASLIENAKTLVNGKYNWNKIARDFSDLYTNGSIQS